MHLRCVLDSLIAVVCTPVLHRHSNQVMSSAEVHCVGDVDDPAARAVRIVHISDTHLMHDSFITENLIPSGDILVHSGDFGKMNTSQVFSGENDYLSEIAAIRTFFSGILHYVLLTKIVHILLTHFCCIFLRQRDVTDTIDMR